MTLLAVSGLTKRFPGVLALDGARLEVGAGEIHALLGENGAGKSTLLKTLSGAQAADSGEMMFDGRALPAADGPRERQGAGIVTIYQEFNLLPDLSIAENMFLGREPRRRGFINWTAMFAMAREVLARLGLDLDPRLDVRCLTVAEQQMVEIARAMTLDAKLIVMDEPTAALSAREVERLHAIARGLQARGVSVIYVTHRLREVIALCDRYTVMRDGRFVAAGDVADVTIDDLVRMMVGRSVEFPRRPPATPGAPVLAVRDLSHGGDRGAKREVALRDISLDVRAGEIVGLAGLVGAGRTAFARLLFGADGAGAGEITIDGRPVGPLRSPRDAMRAGIALVPEDRKQQGCFLRHSIRHNLTLPNLARLRRRGFIDEAAETALVEQYRRRLGIRMASSEVAIGTLSGGNQQKVLLARCMALEPRLLIVDEPTRGIDIGAKAEVHRVLFDLAAQGMAILVISSELPEVMAISDRIVVFCEGRITGTVDAAGADEEMLMAMMAAGDPQARAA